MSIRTTLWLALGGSCLSLSACQETIVETAEIVRPVKIHTIGSLDPAAYRDYPGTLQAFQEARMGFEVAGLVTKFLVQEGDEIEQGQKLAQLDDSDYRAALRAATADRDKAQSQLERSLSIRERNPGAISEEQIEGDRRAVEVAEAQLQIAEKKVADTTLIAPFAGRMARKLVPDFANVQAKEPVLVLQDISFMQIQVSVPERDLVHRPADTDTKEEITQRVQPKVIVSALPEREFPAWIKEFATTAEPITRTFAVTLNFDRPADVTILPGMTARVKVVVNPERAWSVPATAAQSDSDGKYFVWKLEKADPDGFRVDRKVPVELGELVEDRVQLESGIEMGEIVAVSGVTQLREGMRVREYRALK